MNRRDFLKIAALGVMGILKPSFLDVNSETGAKMELSNLWVKIAKNQKLTPQEIDFLRLQGDDTQKRNNQVAGLYNPDGRVVLDSPVITSPQWVDSPAGVLRINVSQIVTSTPAAATLLSTTTSRFFSTVTDRVYLSNPMAVLVSLTGTWQTTPTASASLYIYHYDSNDILTGNLEVNLPLLKNFSISTVVNFLASDFKYFKILMSQSSSPTENLSGILNVSII